MDVRRLVEPAVDWTDQTWGQRLDSAASLLFVHGFIPESTRAQIAQKLDKKYREGLASGEIVMRPKDGDAS